MAHIKTTKLTETLSLSECTDGFWIYDKMQGINISMRAKDETAAFIEAIGYYQRRTHSLKGRVKHFEKSFENFLSELSDSDEMANIMDKFCDRPE